jgi:hypothetical protein
MLVSMIINSVMQSIKDFAGRYVPGCCCSKAFAVLLSCIWFLLLLDVVLVPGSCPGDNMCQAVMASCLRSALEELW